MDYANGKIYTIRSYQTDKIYIGSTTQTLTRRLSKHKSNFKRWKNGGKDNYVSSFELFKYADVYIELLELCPCDTKIELCKREGELIREIDCINKNVAGRTMNEYRADNKEKLKEQTKEWRENNKDKIKDRESIKYDCECGGKYTCASKARHLKTNKHLSKIPIINVVQELV